MNLRPLAGYVLLEQLYCLESTRGGIVSPATSKERCVEAKVVAVGRGKGPAVRDQVQVEVETGDRVLINEYAGTEIEIDGDEYILVRHDEILGTA